MSNTTGGQTDINKFKDLVYEACKHGYDLEFKAGLLKEAASDFKDNNMVNACLLQFPYGCGGIEEVRKKHNGSLTDTIDLSHYADHLCHLSQPHMHHQLFTLILYNLTMKQWMIQSAGWQVQDKSTAAQLANELTLEDIECAVYECQNGNTYNHGAGNHLLRSVDAVSTALPHSNNAAKQMHRNAEAYQHHFEQPSFFNCKS